MFRAQQVTWLLLVGAAPGSDCRFVSGPDGFCAALRLHPTRADLRVGSTLQVRVNGLDCADGVTCVDCTNRRRRVHWQSSAPAVVVVDSTGLIRARQVGTADIRLEVDDSLSELGAHMQVVVTS